MIARAQSRGSGAPSAPSSSSVNTSSAQSSGTLSSSIMSIDWKELLIEITSFVIVYTASLFIGRAILKFFDISSFFGAPSTFTSQEEKQAAARAKEKIGEKKKLPLVLNEHEAIISSLVVFEEDLDTSFDDIGGLEKEKEEIFNLVALPLRRPDLYARSGTRLVMPPKGILLFGPPGTGKTMMARAIAKESGATFINFSTAIAQNKWFGETEKLIRATFSLARKLSPCIIFIDEIDAFLRERANTDSQATATTKAEFMSLWDGLVNNDSSVGNGQGSRRNTGYGVIVIGATNRPWDVDAAILRRMPRTFELKLPNTAQRLSILRLTLRDVVLSEDLESRLEEIAKNKLEGYSGSDIKELCRAAVMVAFKDFVAQNINANPFNEEGEPSSESESMRPLEYNDIMLALNDVLPTGHSAKEYATRSEMFHGTSYPSPSSLPSTPSPAFNQNGSSNGIPTPPTGMPNNVQDAYLLGLYHAFAMLGRQGQ